MFGKVREFDHDWRVTTLNVPAPLVGCGGPSPILRPHPLGTYGAALIAPLGLKVDEPPQYFCQPAPMHPKTT